MKFRTGYDAKRYSSKLSFLDENGEPEKSRTEQCHKNACDVNNIIKRYDQTGLLDHVNAHKAYYGDFTEVNEYQEALNKVMTAQTMFDELPSNIRKEFDNDPGTYFEFVTNPENKDRMIELGLMNSPPEQKETAKEAPAEAVKA